MAEKKVMTKEDLKEQLATENRMQKQDAAKAIDIVFKTIAQGLLDGEYGEVKIAGFGSFQLVVRPSRTGLNPTTKEKIEIPESRAVKFKPSKTLKDLVNSK